MPTTAEMETRVGLIRSEAERLAGYLRELTVADWERPTACDRWQAADVIAHLVWIGEFYIKFVANALQNDLTPPPESPKDPKYASVPPEDFYTLKAFEYRRELGGELLPPFTRHFAELSDLLGTLTANDYERPCFYHSGNRPLWTLADLAVQELAVHTWDIQSRAELIKPAQLPPETLPVLLNRVTQRPQPGASWTAAVGAGPVRLRFVLALPDGAGEAGPDSWDWVGDIQAARWERTPTAAALPAAATFFCAAEIFVLTLYRRLSLASSLADGRITVSGDSDLAYRFADNF